MASHNVPDDVIKPVTVQVYTQDLGRERKQVIGVLVVVVRPHRLGIAVRIRKAVVVSNGPLSLPTRNQFHLPGTIRRLVL